MKKILSILIILLLVMQTFCFAQTTEALPNVNCGVYYDEANQQFNAFMHITKGGYTKNATLYIAAYKYQVLEDLITANLSELEDVDSIYATVDYDSEAAFKDYSFKYFMFDEDLRPLKQFPVFTVQDPPPSDEVLPSKTSGYGYVLYSAYQTSTLTDPVYSVKLITDNGLELLNVAENVLYYYAGDNIRYVLPSYNAFTTSTDGSGTIKGTKVEFLARNQFKLIKYTTNEAGEINAIYEADYDTDQFAFAFDVAGNYDADNFKLDKSLDENAAVFFLASSTSNATPITDSDGFVKNNVINVGGINHKINTSNCLIGTLADLIDDEYYTGKLYVDSQGELGNLLVITTGHGQPTQASSIAVITNVVTDLNEDYEYCYILSYYMDGELKEGVYTSYDVMNLCPDLSEGDIVKINVDKKGVITALDYLVNFGEPVRDTSTGKVNVVSRAADGTKDNYAFGYATTYTRSTRVAEVEGAAYRLSSAQNVYIIDESYKYEKIGIGSTGDFSWDIDVITNADRAKYADYVFIREYDGRVEEIVIIKNIIDYADDNTIVLGDITDVADEAYVAYTAAKAAYEADTTDVDLKAAVIEAANDAYYAAIEAYSYDSSYDISNAEAAKAYADSL